MFGSLDTNLDYSLTQSGNQLFIVNTAKVFSNYFGNNGVSKKSKTSDSTDNSETGNINSIDKTTTNDTIKNNSTEKTDKNSKEQSIQIQYGNNNNDDDEAFSYGSTASIVPSSFEELAAMVGASGNKISKEQLISYLQSLTSDSSDSAASTAEISFIKNLIAQFDTLSGGSDYITSLNGINEAQDYTTITTEQVTSPVDVRV